MTTTFADQLPTPHVVETALVIPWNILCFKNLPADLVFIDFKFPSVRNSKDSDCGYWLRITQRGQKKIVTVAGKSGQFIAGWAGKGQFLWRERGNLTKERIMRKKH